MAIPTREKFYTKYPAFARTQPNSAERRKFLENHPQIAAEWEKTRSVERWLVANYGENWRTAPDLGYYWNLGVRAVEASSPAPQQQAPAPQQAASPAVETYEDPFSPGERNVFAVVSSMLSAYGLGSLANQVLEWSIQGYGQDTIELMLQDTPEYKQRFVANEARRRAGLRVLSPGEYINLENTYRQVMRAAGLPEGFWDSQGDFKTFIENDVDPTEMQERVNVAARYVANTDPYVRQALMTYYGIGDGELTAYILDPKRGMNFIQRSLDAASIGAAAGRQGLSISQGRAEQFADLGVAPQAESAFSQIAEILPDAKRLSEIHAGNDYNQADAEDELLGGMASARRKRQKLADAEASLWAGSSGYSRDQARSTAGAY